MVIHRCEDSWLNIWKIIQRNGNHSAENASPECDSARILLPPTASELLKYGKKLRGERKPNTSNTMQQKHMIMDRAYSKIIYHIMRSWGHFSAFCYCISPRHCICSVWTAEGAVIMLQKTASRFYGSRMSLPKTRPNLLLIGWLCLVAFSAFGESC